MDDRIEVALTVVGFVALLYVWFRAAAVLNVLPLDTLPDPVVALVVPAWLLLPFLVLGGYFHFRATRDSGDGTGAP